VQIPKEAGDKPNQPCKMNNIPTASKRSATKKYAKLGAAGLRIIPRDFPRKRPKGKAYLAEGSGRARLERRRRRSREHTNGMPAAENRMRRRS